jgi:hypothetical protein
MVAVARADSSLAPLPEQAGALAVEETEPVRRLPVVTEATGLVAVVVAAVTAKPEALAVPVLSSSATRCEVK